MGTICYPATILIVIYCNRNTFQSFCLSNSSANRTICCPIFLPAIRLSMYSIRDRRLFRNRFLRHYLYADFFESFCLPCCTCKCSIIYPALIISICLDMCTITNVIIFCKFSCQSHFDCFQPFAFPMCTCSLSSI